MRSICFRSIVLSVLLFSIGLVHNLSAQQKYRFEITSIDSNKYDSLFRKYYKTQSKSAHIDSLDLVKNLLKDIVVFDELGCVISVIPKEGKRTDYEEYDRPIFVSYFPTENIIYLEGGHSSDMSFDLITGEETDLVGLPFYIVPSPKNLFRINGYWSGQECSYYFIQENNGIAFEKVGDIENDELCNMYTSFWTDDRTFYYSLMNADYYAEDEEKEMIPHQGKCFKLTIIDNE